LNLWSQVEEQTRSTIEFSGKRTEKQTCRTADLQTSRSKRTQKHKQMNKETKANTKAHKTEETEKESSRKTNKQKSGLNKNRKSDEAEGRRS